MLSVVHVTHEAVYKVGGIGTVLEGLINSRAYRDEVGRTVLVCPLFYPENTQRLGPGSIVEYSSLDHLYESPYSAVFGQVERDFNVRIVYGHRPLEDAPTGRRQMCEVLLVDLRGINQDRVNALKGRLWDHFGLQSNRYEHIWEFEQYVELAAPAAAALQAMGLGSPDVPAAVFAHEFMGIPTALALSLAQPQNYRTFFHAHEVATVRRLVESQPGHDVMFYNVLEAARAHDLYLDQVFGSQSDYFKHALIQAACFCDATLAVGHHVVHELEFLGSRREACDVTLAYNGVPFSKITVAERRAARERLLDYAETLMNWRPDLVFTHVTRLALSKALWRDLDALLVMDHDLARMGKTAVFFVLSTELPRRPLDDVLRMEREWEWPLAHREGPPDLTGGEARYYQTVQAFNARARNIHAIYINQFGFSRETCGARVPESVEFMDLRRGTDVEFGLSLYEPFGISPLEPLTYGGICVVSTSCGCAGFLKQAAADRGSNTNVVLADYIRPPHRDMSVREAMEIGDAERRAVETEVAVSVAAEILERLPQSEQDEARMIRNGYELAKRMSWDAVAERFVLPAIRAASARRRILSLA